MLALDLVQGIAHYLQEVLVRGDDMPIQRKLDHRLSLADSFDLSHRICRQCAKFGHIRPLKDVAVTGAAFVIGSRSTHRANVSGPIRTSARCGSRDGSASNPR